MRLTHAHARPGGQPGFTLWELLIVVAIVAVTLSLITFSVDHTRELKRVGKDLGKMFHLLSQEAVFENRNFAISVQEKGYLVLVLQDGEWIPSDDRFFTRFKLAATHRSELTIDDQQVDLQPAENPVPHIWILASGEMKPFKWRITDENLQTGILLEGNMLGGVLVTGPEPVG